MLRIRHLVVVLGDQLDHQSAAFDGFDPAQDLVWMAEVDAESMYAWSHKVRITFFLSAMRHFAAQLRERNTPLHYSILDSPDNAGTLEGELRKAIIQFRPSRLVAVEPGEYRMGQMLGELTSELQVQLEIRPDRHFLCSRREFAAWARGKKQLRMEFFYREMRKKTQILMEDGEPIGGKWNYDTENRGSFGKSGPRITQKPISFRPDQITQDVLDLVEKRFSDHPGALADFDFPVTAAEARLALKDFIEKRLPEFGSYQDAMWTDEPFLYHSRLSAAINVKLLDPRTVVMEAQDAFFRGHASLAGTEGFIRQIIGWREYIRGIYWTFMPEYIEGNALRAEEPLPDFYWTGRTEMNCMSHALNQTLRYGYAHHIQRLMVTGLFSLMFGVRPVEIHKWYLAVYVDAVEWVELPNTIGMSQFSDGGMMASKPYVATGKYISRMSNYCKGCRFKPEESTGDQACPFTTLYWDFLMKHETLLARNPRMELQLRNLVRLSEDKKESIRARAGEIRRGLHV